MNDDLTQRCYKRVQTISENADPRVLIELTRPTVPLTEGRFLEKIKVGTFEGLQKTSIALRRPVAGTDPDRIYVAYVADGVAGVRYAPTGPGLTERSWSDVGNTGDAAVALSAGSGGAAFAENAVDVAIAFDGTMPRGDDGKTQFVTETHPWVFWVTPEGACCARKLGLLGSDVTLAENNCAAVSAVRATQSPVSGFDFGLCVFMVLAGKLYYRQLIGGVWYDAELVQFGPEGVSWADVAACRTADWRVVLQAKTDGGDVYELFSQFGNIGSKNAAEHVSGVQHAAADVSLEELHIRTTDTKAPAEHVTMENAVPPAYRFAYEVGAASFLGAENEDDGTGDWGRRVVCRFDRELREDLVQSDLARFTLTDSAGNEFYADTVEMDNTGRKLTLIYISINNAVGDLIVAYTPGSVLTMNGETLGAFSGTFTPRGLVPVAVPELVGIWNE